ncbi:hypothetical protein ACERIM_00835 [Natrinema sp. H-ect1]|uniref:hypothetical protein n=1 Tax=Natrinema sp. H-ect1 TaxID=3242700 RepID=UPI00359EF3AE
MSLVDHRSVDRFELGGVEIVFQIDPTFVSKAVEGAIEPFRKSVLDEFATAIAGVATTDVDPGMSPSREVREASRSPRHSPVPRSDRRQATTATSPADADLA